MDGECGMHSGYKNCIVVKCYGQRPLDMPRGRLECNINVVVKEKVVATWTGFNWLNTDPRADSYEHDNKLKSAIFRDITPCSPLSVNRCFGGTHRHLPGRRNKFGKKPACKQVPLYPRKWYSS
jgi:hypothetical protein